MLIRTLPLVTGLLPIVAIHLSYVIAIVYDRLPACVPYLAGCTSISGTGRYPPASYLFKAVMLPQSVLLLAFWLFTVAWLRALERSTGSHARPGAGIGAMGAASALALVLYVTFLGTEEPFYEFMRRFGIYLYFLFLILSQLTLAVRVRSLAMRLDNATLLQIARAQWLLAAVPFVLGILNLVLKAILDDADASENIIEWIVALAMQVHILLNFWSWRLTGFDAGFSVASR
ncbi:MAG: hypothetical protein U5K76_04960 [Woeseiaceae bacterium]|nr:hypothetical protein [Woeseiaceae bacterium]